MVKQSILVLAVLAGSAMAQTNLGPIVTTQHDDIGRATAPANPPAGKCRRYFNSVTGKETWINSSGGNCGGVGTGTVGGSGTAGSYTGWLDSADITNAPATYVGNDTTFAGNTTANGELASASDGVHAGSVEIVGNTAIKPGLPAVGFWGWNGFNSTSAASYFFQPSATPPTNGQTFSFGTPVTCPSSTANCIPVNFVTPSAGGISPPANPQIGDCLRYNVNGDLAWDATQCASRNSVTLYHEGISGTGPSEYGAVPQFAPGGLGTGSRNFATATDAASTTYTSSASASANTVIGESFGTGANYAAWGFGAFYRWSFRFTPGQTANVRYWMGLTVYDVGGLAGEQVSVFSTTSMAADAPNRHLLGFRYSSTTDTNWMCVASTGTAQTATSTGVAPDTSTPHLFEIAYNATTESCFVDGVLKVQVTTNLPGSTPKVQQFWVGDNKNTANAVSATSYWMTLELK